MTTLCLVERVIPMSADSGRNTSLHDVRTFSGVRRSNAACTFSYINVPPRSPFCGPHVRIVYVCLSYARVGAMFCVHDANVAMRRICLINACARAMSHEAVTIMRCMRFNERACRQIRENVYLPHYNDIASQNICLGNEGGG